MNPVAIQKVAADLRAAIIVEMPKRLHRSVAARRSAATKISYEASFEVFTRRESSIPGTTVSVLRTTPSLDDESRKVVKNTISNNARSSLVASAWQIGVSSRQSVRIDWSEFD